MRHAEEPITLIVGVSPTGVGAAIARRLAQEGHHLVLASRRAKELGPLEAELREQAGSVRVMRCDATKRRHCSHLIDDILVHNGRLDNFVYTPGRPMVGPFLETPIEALDVQLEENLRTPWRWLQNVLPVMREHGGGTIVFLSAGTGNRGAPHLGAFSAAKHALHGLLETVAREHERESVQTVALVIDGDLERDKKAEEPPLTHGNEATVRLSAVADAVAEIINEDAPAMNTEYWLGPEGPGEPA